MVLPCSGLCVFLSFKHFDHLAWGRGSWSLCLSCICLFVSYAHVYLYHFSRPPGVLVSGLGCGLCLWRFLDISIYLFSRPMSKSVIISCQFYMNVFTIDVIVNFNETKRKEEEINFPF